MCLGYRQELKNVGCSICFHYERFLIGPMRNRVSAMELL